MNKTMKSVQEKGTDILNRMDNVNGVLANTLNMTSELIKVLDNTRIKVNELAETNKRYYKLIVGQNRILKDLIIIYGEEELKEKLIAHNNMSDKVR